MWLSLLSLRKPTPSHLFLCLYHPRTANNTHLSASESTGGFFCKRTLVIARWLLASNATARRGKCRVSSLGVLGLVGERAHPGGRRQSEQRRAGVRACHFHNQPQVDAQTRARVLQRPVFWCIPDRQTHFPSLAHTRATIGMLNLTLKPRGLYLGRREEATAQNRAQFPFGPVSLPQGRDKAH